MYFIKRALFLLADQILKHPNVYFYRLNGEEYEDYGTFYHAFSNAWLSNVNQTIEQPVDPQALYDFTVKYVTDYVDENADAFINMSYEELDTFILTLSFALMEYFIDDSSLHKYFPYSIPSYPQEWKDNKDPSREGIEEQWKVWKKEDEAAGLYYDEAEYDPFKPEDQRKKKKTIDDVTKKDIPI